MDYIYGVPNNNIPVYFKVTKALEDTPIALFIRVCTTHAFV